MGVKTNKNWLFGAKLNKCCLFERYNKQMFIWVLKQVFIWALKQMFIWALKQIFTWALKQTNVIWVLKQTNI